MLLFLGGLLGMAGAFGQSALSYSYSKKLQQRQFDWQERMSNTAYQRAMADMRQAGLNPILAYKQGGATTPSGSGGTAPTVDNPVTAGLQAASAVQQVRQTKALVGKTQAEKRKLDAEIEELRERKKAQVPLQRMGGKVTIGAEKVFNAIVREMNPNSATATKNLKEEIRRAWNKEQAKGSRHKGGLVIPPAVIQKRWRQGR